MNKETYLQELRKGLKLLPQYDREEAIEFYEEYFDDAGVENEQKVIEELGEPKILAKKILVDLVDRRYEESLAASASSENALAVVPAQPVETSGSNAAYVETPAAAEGAQYQAAYQAQPQAAAPQYQPQPQAQQKESPSALKTLLIVLAAIFALPLSPVLFALLIVVCVMIFVVFIVLASFVISGFAMLVSGFVTIIFGIVALFMNPVAAMVILGGGLSCFGLGIFFMAGSIALIRLTAHGLAKGFGRIVHKKNKKNRAAQATA